MLDYDCPNCKYNEQQGNDRFVKIASLIAGAIMGGLLVCLFLL